MSQLHKPGLVSRARRMGARYGVTGGKAAAAFLCVVLACAAIVGIWLSVGGAGVEIERTADAAVEAADAGNTDAVDGKADGQGAAPAQIIVHVDGAVAVPGVYLLSESSRVNDAVLAAGGLAECADTSTTNLAAPLADGAKVHIPTSEELAAPLPTEAGNASSSSSGGSPASSGIVNINTAASAELQTLSGVGEATAQAIIEERESNGPFTSPEDLMRVSGIGEKKFAKIKDRICV